MKNIITLFLSIFSISAFSQIEVEIMNATPNNNVVGFYVALPNVWDVQAKADTIYSNKIDGKTGIAKIENRLTTPGIYDIHLLDKDNKSITSGKIAFDKASIKGQFAATEQGVNILWNDELNKAYSDFSQEAKMLLDDIKIIYPVAKDYPYKDGDYYKLVVKKYNQIKDKYNKFYENLDNFPSRKLAQIIKVERLYTPQASEKDSLIQKNTKEFNEKNFSFKNPLFHDQQIYVDKLMQSLSEIVYNQERLPTRTMSDDLGEFISTKLPVGTQRYSKDVEAIHYLLLQYGKDNEAEYVEVNFKAKLPEYKNNKALQDRLKSYQSLAIGNKAPDATFVDINGKTQTLYGIKAPKTVVAFWAPWCTECARIRPSVVELTKKYPKVQFVGFGVDDNETAWREKAVLYPGWIQVQSKGKWDGEYIKKYNIQSVPFFIVLDENKVILGRAANAQGVEEFLK